MLGGRSFCVPAWPWVSTLPPRSWTWTGRTGAISVPGGRSLRSRQPQMRSDSSSGPPRPQMLRVSSFLPSLWVWLLELVNSQARRPRQLSLPGKAISCLAHTSVKRLPLQLLQVTIQPRTGTCRAGRATPASSSSFSAPTRLYSGKGHHSHQESRHDLGKWGGLGNPPRESLRLRSSVNAAIFILRKSWVWQAWGFPGPGDPAYRRQAAGPPAQQGDILWEAWDFLNC
jgi:hypothetical protein